MKKVACITPINTPNYGTVLQAFALQEAVKKMGYDYSILNYCQKEQELKFTFFGHTKYMNLKYRIAKKVLYPIRKYQCHKILSFQNQYNQLSERYMTRQELNACKEKYDSFIVGSDQVWNNQELNHFDDSYYLAFAGDKNKIAYAASFGKTYSMLKDEDLEFYKKQIPNVDFISVREKSGSDIIKKTTGRNSKWVCDPVYLLTREEWDKYLTNPEVKGYILVYLVGGGINFDINKKIVAIANKIAKEQNLEVITVCIGLSAPMYGSVKIPTVQEWIGLIKNADLVLSNSFHGTAFSTIFKRKFYTFVRGGADNRMNARIYDLLVYLGLEERVIGFDEEKDTKIMYKETISFETAAKKIEAFRQQSLDFLKNSLNGLETLPENVKEVPSDGLGGVKHAFLKRNLFRGCAA